jgi:nucleotide-binding universal stress UspA family protein
MAAEGVFRSILVLVDGSESQQRAAEKAIQIASAHGARLAALAVVDTDTLKQLLSSRIFIQEEMEDYERELEVSARRQLGYVSKLARQANVPVEEVLVKGACHSGVLSQQKELAADLVVLAAFKSTARRDLLAHEKQLVIDQCPAAVLVVR